MAAHIVGAGHTIERSAVEETLKGTGRVYRTYGCLHVTSYRTESDNSIDCGHDIRAGTGPAGENTDLDVDTDPFALVDLGRWIVENSIEACKPFTDPTENMVLRYDPDRPRRPTQDTLPADDVKIYYPSRFPLDYGPPLFPFMFDSCNPIWWAGRQSTNSDRGQQSGQLKLSEQTAEWLASKQLDVERKVHGDPSPAFTTYIKEALADHQAMVVQDTPAIGKNTLDGLTLFLASSFPLPEKTGPTLHTIKP